MKCKQSGSVLIIRFDDGEEIVSILLDLCRRKTICGGVVSAIGAVRDAEISVFDVATKKYNDRTVKENCEILSLNGFISIFNDKSHVHLHVSLAGADFKAVGGHLKRAVASPTCEMAITITDKLERETDAASGLALLELK